MTDAVEKKYYTIREVSELLGLPLPTLRYWESRFTIIKPRRTSTGRRMYTSSDIEKIRMVYYLVRDKGLHLDAAQDHLRNDHTGVGRKSEAVARLEEIRCELQSMLDALNRLR